MIQQYIIYGLAATVVLLGGYAYVEYIQLERCELASEVATAVSKAEAGKLQERVAVYDKDVLAITAFYDKELANINKEERRPDETECDAAARVLTNFKY